MDFYEKFSFSYKDKNITIEIREFKEYDQIIYVAKPNFKNIIVVAENWETALHNCIKKIKFAFLRLEKKVKLMNESQAIAIAKGHFCEEFEELYRRYGDRLSYSVSVEDEVMTFDMLVSAKGEPSDKIMPSVAIVYVNLITGECDLVKNCKEF